jgi:hypothetical protein
MSSFDSVSPILVGVCIVVLLSVFVEIGYRVGRRIGSENGLSKHPVEASASTAILGLLAFTLCFSFSISVGRSAKRKEIILHDVNTAGTLYRRADFLPSEMVQPARDLIGEYLNIRADAPKDTTPERIASVIERSAQVQMELWAIAVQARSKSDNASLNLFITTLNELFDADAKRKAIVFVNRLPSALWYTLAFLGTLSTVMLGLSSGLHGRRSRLATTALIISFTVVVVLIVDIDRPVRALFKSKDALPELSLRGINLGQRYSQELAESEYEAHLEEAYADLETTTALKVTLPWATQEFEETRALMGNNYWPHMGSKRTGKSWNW